MTKQPTRIYTSLALPFGILLLGVTLTLGAGRIAQRSEAAARQSRFERLVGQIRADIRGRMEDSVQMLQNSAALFAANQQVSRKAWHAYVDTLDLEANFPGTLSLGYAAYVRPPRLSAFIASVRADGFADYHLQPGGTRDFYTPVVYLEPLTLNNQRAFGFDMASEPTRRAAIERARDTGTASLTGRVTLRRSGERSQEPGAVLYVPVYRQDMVAYTKDERRAAVQGFVFCPFRIEQLMQQALSERSGSLAIELFDGAGHAAADRLFADNQGALTTNADYHPAFDTYRRIEVAGHPWTLHAVSTPTFDASFGRSKAGRLVIGGLLISSMGFLITFSLVETRRRALVIAADLSRAHQQSEERIRAVMDGTADAILSVGLDGRVRSSNRAAQRIYGYTEQEFLDLSVSDLSPGRDHEKWAAFVEQLRAEGLASVQRQGVESVGVRKDGREVRLLSSISTVEIDGEWQLVCVCADITERRANEQEARRADALRRAVLHSAPFCIITTDTHGLITGINPAGEALLGYQADELVGKHTPSLIHEPEEVMARAEQLRSATGRPVQTVFEVFVGRSDEGLVEQHEWHYVRKDGQRVPVQLTVSALRDAEGRLTGYLGVASDMSERKRTDEYIRHMALHDKLTGLPNRALLQDHADVAIMRARRQLTSVAVLLLDLDRFKHINDSLGHHVGDEVLQIVAQRLNECVRSTDTVVRMGGDEFVILLPDLKNKDEALHVADKVMAALSKDLMVGAHMLRITPSVGIANYPENGSDLSTLLRNADAAMYHAKDLGRNNVQVFEPNLTERLSQRLEIEAELSHAIERDELVLFYQPLVDGRTGLVCGVEALLRWRHPVRGMVSPLDFIPIAEETGLILPIGEWVMRTACHDIKLLNDQIAHPLRLAVNLSPRQFNQPRLVDSVQQVLDASGMPAHLLELEITEGVLMRDVEQTLVTLKSLRGIGVHLAIDDFGTGFSSLSYLSRFPIQTLKVDRSFVKDIGTDDTNTAIASAVIGMAHTLGLRVVAEGVETVAQRDYLRTRRCDELQGFLFSKPVPVDELAQRIEAVQAA